MSKAFSITISGEVNGSKEIRETFAKMIREIDKLRAQRSDPLRGSLSIVDGTEAQGWTATDVLEVGDAEAKARRKGQVREDGQVRQAASAAAEAAREDQR